MNIRELSVPTLIALHSKIRQCLFEDDTNERGRAQKVWCVRDTPDWRKMADAFEAEMQRRELEFAPIDWARK